MASCTDATKSGLKKMEDMAEQIVHKTKRFLPIIARFCFVFTFIEHSIHLYFYWNEQVNFLSSQLEVSVSVAAFLVGYNMIAQLVAATLIMMRKFTTVACGVLFSVILAQIIEYKVYGHLPFLSRFLALLGGVVLLMVEAWPQAHVTSASLPSVGTDRPKNILQLVGRIMVVLMFLTMVNLEMTALQIIYNILGIPLVLLVAVGYKTKLSALVLVAICMVINLVYYSFWFVPTTDQLHELLKYNFFHMCSIIGSLLFIVDLGAGGVSIDDNKKNW